MRASRQLARDDAAGAAGSGGELGKRTIHRGPVVRGIDDDVTGKGLRGERVDAVQGDGEDHKIGALDGLARGGGDCATREDIHRERDVLGVAGAGDADLVAGRYREPRQDRAEFAGAEDADDVRHSTAPVPRPARELAAPPAVPSRRMVRSRSS